MLGPWQNLSLFLALPNPQTSVPTRTLWPPLIPLKRDFNRAFQCTNSEVARQEMVGCTCCMNQL